MRCCKSTCQDSTEKSPWIEAMSEVNRLVPNDALLEKFVDLPDLLARVENDRELLTELFVMFQEELPGLQDALHHAIDAGDLPEGVKAAHALKGMLANMSMKKGSTMAASIETAARAGNIGASKETLVAFDSEIAALSAAVDAFLART
jgi:HPt (histidine-containing phosphotransfer) domain-containing protein